mmetsp:Transcript_26489/g.45615  ORF Transcript_26489/g.45615 Transcript_26489/m.45615 type:complete len:520 (+) Transcript_26489:90-1649(+)|eukprot:CAMPEP_0196653544 /NCGR_PEP_ID=MMETSP1086-20130531/3181_1 /TAXON_ID=77921 /ORGANISM="Cyanoptyche  gloeocystis , Strain SAG4.97" /LENGTH=519 /DNA_ID=CAMNT_0041984807 /DNA_START=88 /DNA_END=1647 /DNA_ORIENTATION=-
MKRASLVADPNAKTSASVLDFQQVVGKQSESLLEQDLDKLVDSCPDPVKKDGFRHEMKQCLSLFQRWRTESESKEGLVWDEIKTPGTNVLIPYEKVAEQFVNVAEDEDVDRALLDKLVVLKLNGGLGTTMGCQGPKSVIEVRAEGGNEYTFLDLTVQQVAHLNRKYGAQVPLVLMNSFNTDADTEKVIRKYQDKVQIYTFSQKRFPRIWKESMRPCPKDFTGKLSEWYPPGHGDFYDSFVRSDLYRTLKNLGKELVFVSNIDNLGATVDLNILRWLDANPKCEFCIETTNKTRADVKGGTIVEYEGKVKLLELAQVPSKKVEEFKSIKKFKVFNTNNLWLRLDAIETRLPELKLDIIVNYKQEAGQAVIQLETACGAAIEYFKNAVSINVPRERFLPVKSCSDLLLVQSKLYKMEHGTLKMNPKRLEAFGDTTIPVIKLGDNFKKVGDYSKRFKGFPEALPDITELEHLTVSGDVTFGENMTLKGTVIIVAPSGLKIDLPPGSILENKVITGGLHILDH